MNAKELRNLLSDLTSRDLVELILAQHTLEVLDKGFQSAGADNPEWVTDGMMVVQKEIIDRNRAELMRKLKTAQARRASLATREEQRAGLDQEIADLKQKLG